MPLAMLRLLFIWVAVSAFISVLEAASCDWTKNVNGGRLPPHLKEKYVACLFDTLENQTLKEFKANDPFHIKTGKKVEDILGLGFNPLKLPPDSDFIRGNPTRTVSIVDAEIRQANVFTTAERADVEGYLHLRWKDPRLKWSSAAWQLNKVTPTSYVTNKIWFPLFKIRKFSGKGSSQASELIPATIGSDGTVDASAFLDWECPCKMNTKNYPSDTAKCSVTIEGSWVNRSDIKLAAKVKNIRPSNMYKSSYYWQFQSAQLRTRTNNHQQFLDISIEVKRINNAGHIEILTPILIATIIAMVAPLFGGFKWQSIIKVVALLLMYLSLMSFVRVHWVMRHAPTIPKLLEFHRYTMAVTLIAMLISLGLWTIARKSPTLPPPHWLVTITDKLPGCCLCLETPNEAKEEGTEATTETQWANTLSLINCMVFFLFLAIYIIGIIVYCA